MQFYVRVCVFYDVLIDWCVLRVFMFRVCCLLFVARCVGFVVCLPCLVVAYCLMCDVCCCVLCVARCWLLLCFVSVVC